MINSSIKILDCTLRDGGYIINWSFGENVITSIIKKLHLAGIDYIECGFLKELEYNKNKSFFSSIKDLEKILNPNQKYTLMVNYGEYDISNFKECNSPNIRIRVAFKKYNQREALEYIQKLKNLGWEVGANPMHTNTYSKEELAYLLEKFNEINPESVSIVDTLGNMYEHQVLDIFRFLDDNLNKNISIGFHSHNAMQLSFSNTKAILNMNLCREIIIDSCTYGMGRGAGNLCTELITKYLNDNYEKNYKIFPVLKIIDNDLKPFYNKTPWGYSTPYYIAAIYGCHPNYATFLVKQKLSDEEIHKIISKISDNKKIIYDENYINELQNRFYQYV